MSWGKGRYLTDLLQGYIMKSRQLPPGYPPSVCPLLHTVVAGMLLVALVLFLHSSVCAVDSTTVHLY